MRQGVHMGRGRLKSGEAADYLHISYQTLRKYILNNEIEYTRTPGGQTSFTQKQLDQFLQNKLGHEPAHKQHQQLAFYLRDSQGNQERINRQKLEQAYGQPIQTYQDKASGLNENRKGLQRLLNDAQQGKNQHHSHHRKRPTHQIRIQIPRTTPHRLSLHNTHPR